MPPFFYYEMSQNSLILKELVLGENDIGHTGIRGGYYRNRLIRTMYIDGERIKRTQHLVQKRDSVYTVA